MMLMKRLLLACAGIAAAAAFLGCEKKVSTGKDTIVFWHWISDRNEIFEQLAERFKKETGITVKFELYAPSEAYSSKVIAAAQTETLPDIFGVLGETKNFANFVKEGLIYNLNCEMNENNGQWRKQFFARSLASNIFLKDNQYGVEPGIYGVPIDVTNIQMIYNKDLLKKAGLNPDRPPETWEEFIKYIEKLNESNISGFVSGWGEVWLIDCFANNFAFNILGEKKIMDTYAGKVPYTDPDWIKVLSLFEQLKNKKALLPGTITMVNKIAEQSFALGRAAFTFNGSWAVNVYEGMNPDLNYAVMLPPKVTDSHPLKIWGWGGSSFVINAKSTKKEQCVKFLKWLTSKDTQILLAEKTNNLPSNKESLGRIHPVLAQFAEGMDSSTHPSNWKLREDPKVSETFTKGIQAILTGQKTPQQVAREVDSVKKKIINKNKTVNM